jgi:shikimate kinase
MNIALIGYRGTGKTSVAQALAARLGWRWEDADVLLEQQAGKTIQQIFMGEGESSFRDREAAILAELVNAERTVLALGGGVVLRPENRRRLAGSIVVWLRADVETLYDRIRQDPASATRRPNLGRGGIEEIAEALAQRIPLYQECANYVVDTETKTPEQIAGEIVFLLKDVPGVVDAD